MLAPSVHVHLPWDQLQQQGPSPQNDQPGPPGPLTPKQWHVLLATWLKG